MGIFSTKQIASRDHSVGALLKNTRLKHKLKLHHIEEFTNIRRSYIIAIENNQWDQLPDLSYAKNFVLTYAKFLELDSNKILNRYKIEVENFNQNSNNITTPSAPAKRGLIITPFTLTIAAVVLIFGGVIFYTSFQLNHLLQTPKLALNEPQDYLEVSVNKVNVSGQTDPENIIYINEQPLTTDKNGNFNTPVQLKEGYNIVTVTAKNKSGKTTTATKVIVAKLPNNNSADQKPYNLTITARNQDIWIRLKDSEQQNIFDDIIYSNQTKSFDLTDTTYLTTTNAGATDINLDQKSLGTIGQAGQIIEDLAISNHPTTKNI